MVLVRPGAADQLTCESEQECTGETAQKGKAGRLHLRI